jgi:Sensors of blue-light using FAD
MVEVFMEHAQRNNEADALYQLIYHSYASVDFGTDDLLKMLIDARISNERKNITGMLLYHDAQFLQMLEGNKQVLQELSDKIFDDPRHFGAARLSFNRVDSRDFLSWSMGFANLNEDANRNIRGARHFFDENAEWQSHVCEADKAKKLLLRFKNSKQTISK